MPDFIDIHYVSGDLNAVARALREAGDNELRKELNKELNTTAKLVVEQMRTAVRGVSTTSVMSAKAPRTKLGALLSKGSAKKKDSAALDARAKSGRTASGGSGGKARAAHATRNRTVSLAEAAATGKRVSSRKAFARAAARNRGLRNAIAGSVRVSTKTGGHEASVSVTAGSSKLPADQRGLPQALNKGRWRHPYFGTSRWVTQQVSPPGWFTKTAAESAPFVTAQMAQTIDKYAAKIVAKAAA